MQFGWECVTFVRIQEGEERGNEADEVRLRDASEVL